MLKKTSLLTLILLFSFYASTQGCYKKENIKKSNYEKLHDVFFEKIEFNKLNKLKEFLKLIKKTTKIKIDFNRKDKSGRTAIWIACQRCNEALTKYLIEKKADVNCVCNGASLLYWACECKNKSLAKILFENGAKMDDTATNYLQKTKEKLRNEFIKIVNFENYLKELEIAQKDEQRHKSLEIK